MRLQAGNEGEIFWIWRLGRGGKLSKGEKVEKRVARKQTCK